jgi:hypothetical protein
MKVPNMVTGSLQVWANYKKSIWVQMLQHVPNKPGNNYKAALQRKNPQAKYDWDETGNHGVNPSVETATIYGGTRWWKQYSGNPNVCQLVASQPYAC